MTQTYKCAMCGGVFDKGWTDEEASAEFSENFKGFDIHRADLVCDDCYQKVHPSNHPLQVELAKREELGKQRTKRSKDV